MCRPLLVSSPTDVVSTPDGNLVDAEVSTCNGYSVDFNLVFLSLLMFSFYYLCNMFHMLQIVVGVQLAI